MEAASALAKGRRAKPGGAPRGYSRPALARPQAEFSGREDLIPAPRCKPPPQTLTARAAIQYLFSCILRAPARCSGMAETSPSLVWKGSPVPQEYSGPPAPREHGRVLVQQRGPQGSAGLTREDGTSDRNDGNHSWEAPL